MIPGFVGYSYVVYEGYIGKKRVHEEKLGPASISLEECYEICKSNNCYCWELPEGGCQPGTEICHEGNLRRCQIRCRMNDSDM